MQQQALLWHAQRWRPSLSLSEALSKTFLDLGVGEGIAEVQRILRPADFLIVSSPERDVYSQLGSHTNPYVHEFLRWSSRPAERGVPQCLDTAS